MIILGKRYELYNVDTFKYLIEYGANIHADEEEALIRCADKGYLDIVKFFLVKSGANIHANSDHAVQAGASNGHLDIVKYLVGCSADVCADNNLAICLSAEHGHLDIVKYLVEKKLLIFSNKLKI